MWIRDHFLFVVVLMAAVIFGFLVIAIRVNIKRRRKYKAFLDEDLTNHLGDNLNAKYYDDASRYSITTYFYDQLMQYAISIAMKDLKKRDRYDSNGEYTAISAQRVADMQENARIIFTDNATVLSNGYTNFITEYRPEYKVCDFSKSLVEYISFVENPSSFTKHAKTTNNVEQQSVQQDQVSKFVDNDFTEIKNNSQAEEVIEKSPKLIAMSVDKDVILVLDEYAMKLAKSKKAKRPDIDLDAEYKNNYGKLSKMFFNGRSFNDKFISWVQDNEPDSSIDDFKTLIPIYIRHIKTK